jgi:hypothetical protein
MGSHPKKHDNEPVELVLNPAIGRGIPDFHPIITSFCNS